MSQIISDRLIRASCDVEEYLNLKDLENRKLYLSSGINALDCEESCNQHLSRTGHIIKQIFDFDEQEKDLRPDERIPIRLFINSPGGDISEGFFFTVRHRALKTPIHTIYIGIWVSMAFWIGITGHKRFALPHTEFLLHEGKLFTVGSAGSVQDTVDFDKRYKEEVIKSMS